MGVREAEAFMERAEKDEAFASEIEALGTHPDAVVAKLNEAGYDVTPDDIQEALVERYGVELTPEQLDQIAAGADAEMIAGATIGAVAGTAMVAAICAGLA